MSRTYTRLSLIDTRGGWPHPSHVTTGPAPSFTTGLDRTPANPPHDKRCSICHPPRD